MKLSTASFVSACTICALAGLLAWQRTAVAHARTMSRAAGDDSLVIDALRRAAAPLAVKDGVLQGRAAQVLDSAMTTAQFVLVGESHGFVEPPAFTAALFDLARPHGFRHLAVETGMLAGRAVDSLAREHDAPRAFRTFYATYPFSIAFYYWREEQEMVTRAVAGTRARDNVIWGFDQELMFSPEWHFATLSQQARTPAARRFASELATRARSSFDAVVREHNPTKGFLLSASDVTFDSVQRNIVPATGNDGVERLTQLRASRAIYLDFMAGRGFQSNVARSALMKRNFASSYQRAQAAGERTPKVMFKVGVDHAMNGRTITNVQDLGALTHELAAMNGMQALSILLVIGHGAQNAWLPFVGDTAALHRRFNAASDPAGELTMLGATTLLSAAEPMSGWTLFDLRPVRALLAGRKLGSVSEQMQRVLYAYDMVVIIPEGHASTLTTGDGTHDGTH